MDTEFIGYLGTEDHTFFLPMGRIIAVERETECSVFELLHGLGAGLGRIANELVLVGPSPATLAQCHSVIRNALIGGGMEEKAAAVLVETYCYPARPAVRDLALAFQILDTLAYGVQLKKKETTDEPDGDEGEPQTSNSEKA